MRNRPKPLRTSITIMAPPDDPAGQFYENQTAPRINTDALIFKSIQGAHPGSQIWIVPEFSCPLRVWVTADPGSRATIKPLSPEDTLTWTMFFPPARRLDGSTGGLARETFYEKYLLTYANTELLVYFVDGRDGSEPFGVTRNQYIVGPPSAGGLISTLLRACGTWATSLHNEIWVFDQGWWDKDAQLYESIMKSSWDNVILHRALKEDLVETITRFYDSRDTYHRLGVPWKRGIIFYGPPGNGKTISIKATMHTLYARQKDPIPTLYVKSLKSFGGPEFSISQIFRKARAEAPCYLVFEDLDSSEFAPVTLKLHPSPGCCFFIPYCKCTDNLLHSGHRRRPQLLPQRRGWTFRERRHPNGRLYQSPRQT